jgi:hypothetical protein
MLKMFFFYILYLNVIINPMYQPNFMIDIETLSTRSNATIVSIGAIKFDRKNPTPELKDMKTFYTKIDIDSCKEKGMHVDDSTIQWWGKQDPQIRWEALENKDGRVSINEALQTLRDFIEHNSEKAPLIWANGDDFDCVILAEAFRLCYMPTPWKFWDTRDVRTVLDLAGIKQYQLPKVDKHHPVNDCWRQIYGIKNGFDNLGLY